VVVAAFVIAGYFNEDAVSDAVLTCNLTALIWYVLAMVCLFLLRWRNPHLPRPYKVPFYPFLPALVLLMSLFAAGIYVWYYWDKVLVTWLTVALYIFGIAYYLLIARRRLVSAAPEELAARAGHEKNN
jgi:ethanolamine permease